MMLQDLKIVPLTNWCHAQILQKGITLLTALVSQGDVRSLCQGNRGARVVRIGEASVPQARQAAWHPNALTSLALRLVQYRFLAFGTFWNAIWFDATVEAKVLCPEVYWKEAGGAAKAREVYAFGAGDQLAVLSPVHNALHCDFSGQMKLDETEAFEYENDSSNSIGA